MSPAGPLVRRPRRPARSFGGFGGRPARRPARPEAGAPGGWPARRLARPEAGPPGGRPARRPDHPVCWHPLVSARSAADPCTACRPQTLRRGARCRRVGRPRRILMICRSGRTRNHHRLSRTRRYAPFQGLCVGLGATMWTVLPEGETRGRHARQSPTIREANPPRETEPARKPTPKHGPRALIGQIRYRGPDARGDTVPSLRHPSGPAPRRAGVASGLAKTLGGSRHLFGIGVMRGSSLLASRARLSGTLTRDLSGTPQP